MTRIGHTCHSKTMGCPKRTASFFSSYFDPEKLFWSRSKYQEKILANGTHANLFFQS